MKNSCRTYVSSRLLEGSRSNTGVSIVIDQPVMQQLTNLAASCPICRAVTSCESAFAGRLIGEMTGHLCRTIIAVLLVVSALGIFASDKAQAGKECREGHWHYGGSGSTPIKSKKAAIRAAISSWAGFTAWEYGTEWAYFNQAADRNISCEKHPGRRWTCSVEGRPCKRTR